MVDITFLGVVLFLFLTSMKLVSLYCHLMEN